MSQKRNTASTSLLSVMIFGRFNGEDARVSALSRPGRAGAPAVKSRSSAKGMTVLKLARLFHSILDGDRRADEVVILPGFDLNREKRSGSKTVPFHIHRAVDFRT